MATEALCLMKFKVYEQCIGSSHMAPCSHLLRTPNTYQLYLTGGTFERTAPCSIRVAEGVGSTITSTCQCIHLTESQKHAGSAKGSRT